MALDHEKIHFEAIMRMLVLLDDSFGGRGGVAKFNTDFLCTLSKRDDVSQIYVVQRVPPDDDFGSLPEKISFFYPKKKSNRFFTTNALRASLSSPKFELLVTGLLYLLPVGTLCQRLTGARHATIMHGVEAWQPTNHRLANQLAPRVPHVISVSQETASRFRKWSGSKGQIHLTPNSIDLQKFTPGPKEEYLLNRYGLHNRRIIMTLGRLSSMEQYKGMDQILEALPELIPLDPSIIYLLCGSGDDMDRLKSKASALGVSQHVVFTGYIPNEEKLDHLRLADAFLLAGWGEGFGIVLLEAMACGIPVIASKLDASREAVREGRIGLMVNPLDRAELVSAIMKALSITARIRPAGLEYFSIEEYEKRLNRTVDVIMAS